MEDQLLRVFVTAVEKENFTRAAEILHMTQPAVSQHIKTLEARFGARLLERSNKYVQLTKAGEIVYHYAKEIIGCYTQMQNLVDDLTNKASGKIAIGASYTFGEYILPHIVSYLKDKYPLIKPKITIANTKRISEWVVNQQLDIGIIDGNINHKNLQVEPFAEDMLFIVVPANHKFANQSEFDPADLKKETWIIREATSGTREAAEKMFAHLNFYPEKIMEFGSTQLIKESVEAGLGITLLSHCTIQKELVFGTLKKLNIEDTTPFKRKFSITIRPVQFQIKAIEVFINILRKNEGFPLFFADRR